MSISSFMELKPTLVIQVNQPNNSITIHNFIITIQSESNHKRRIMKMKDKLGRESSAFEGLAMVDAIQRLNIEHHFVHEIHEVLLTHYTIPANHDQTSLHEVSLRFRLLRQQGYYVPTGVFDNFKNDTKFKEELSCNVKGLVDLYEASHLSIVDEDELIKAKEYSYELLNSLMLTNNLDFGQAKAVQNSLKHPFYESLPSFMSKNFLVSYFNLLDENQWMNDLQEVADHEFHIVQLQHKEEIVQISKWWEDMGLSKELKLARNQPLKWFIWPMAILTDPSLSQQRINLIKPISLVYILDDIFDVYGTLEELTLFTNVVIRWDYSTIEQLPDYMKICFQALDKVTDEISLTVYKNYGWNPVNSLRKSWASLCSAFLVEAKWFLTGNSPSVEEYLENGTVSTGVHTIFMHLFFLLGESINKETVKFVEGNPEMIHSTAKILRLWDDLGSAKDENQEGVDGSYVEYYMKENVESSRESARNHVLDMISDTWKQLNQESLFHNPFSATFTKACLNGARMVPLMYSYGENCSLPLLEEVTKRYMKQILSK